MPDRRRRNRACPRLVIPGGIARKTDLLTGYPVLDISRGGVSFLSDYPQKQGKLISLLLRLPGEDQDLRLEGRVIYAVPNESIGYKYRIGIGFQPFLPDPGCNPPEAERKILQLERKLTGERVRRSGKH